MIGPGVGTCLSLPNEMWSWDLGCWELRNRMHSDPKAAMPRNVQATGRRRRFPRPPTQVNLGVGQVVKLGKGRTPPAEGTSLEG